MLLADQAYQDIVEDQGILVILEDLDIVVLLVFQDIAGNMLQVFGLMLGLFIHHHGQKFLE